MAAYPAGEPPTQGNRSRGQMRPGVVTRGRQLVWIEIQDPCQRANVLVGHKRDLAGLNVAQPRPITTYGGGYLSLRQATQAAGVENQPAQRPTINVVECTLLQLAPRH